MTPKLGKLPRSHDPRIPHLTALRLALAPDHTPNVVGANWLTKVDPSDLGMMCNDQYGCCVEAGSFHGLQILSSFMNRDGLEITEPDACVLKAYEEVTGFNPTDPATDQGTDMQAYLKHWLNVGIPTGPGAATRHRCAAFVEIDPKDRNGVLEAIAACGFVYLGFNVPNFIMGGDEGDPADHWFYPPQAGADEGSDGGHCVIAAAANSGGLTIVSWGRTYEMNWPFWDQYVDECYAVIDPDWSDGHHTPMGIPLAQLVAQMEALAREGPAG